MEKKTYSDDELKEIAKGIIETLRPNRLCVWELRKIFQIATELLDYIVLRER